MASKPKKLDDTRLQAIVEAMIADAVSYDSSDRKGRRELALAYMAGDMPDLVAEKDQSSVVSQDLADAKAWLLPSLMRVFCASDRIAIYEPETPGDEAFAEQASDYVNFLFLRECDGEMLLRDVLDDGLGLGNGIVKHWWDPTPEHRVYTYTDLPEGAFVDLVSSDDVEVLEHSERPDPSAGLGMAVSPGMDGLPPNAGMAGAGPAGGLLPPPNGMEPSGGAVGGQPPVQAPPPGAMAPGGMAGQAVGGGPATPPVPMSPLGPAVPGANPLVDLAGIGGDVSGTLAPPPMLHDVKIRRVVRNGRVRVVAVPDEDFGIESAATGLNERECRFCYHRETPTRSELVERGYDMDTVWELGSVSESVDRSDRRTSWYAGTNARDDYEDKAGERVEIYECYALLDVDGDGIAEWHQIVMGGTSGSQKLLDSTEWGGMLPFTDIVPDPVPHVWRGRSLYDRLRDVQRVKTVLQRKTLDNLYQVMEPGEVWDITRVDNPDAVYDRGLGRVVRTRGNVGDIYTSLAVPFVGQYALPVMAEMDKIAERRVGVGEQSAGLDADALQAQTATAVAAAQSSTGQRTEDYARNIQVGLRRVFSALLKLTVEHQDRERTIRLRDKWVPIDPRSWNAEMDVTVNVGLGAGNRDRDLAMLQGIAAKQEMIIAQIGPKLGLENPIMGVDQYFTTLRMMVEAAGVKSPERFFPEINEGAKQALAQAMQAEQQKPDPKAQAAMQKMQADAQAQQMKAQTDAQIAQGKAQADAQLNAAKMQQQQAIAEAKLQGDMRVREADAQHRMDMDRAKAQQDMAALQWKAQTEQQLAQAKADAQLQIEQVKAQAQLQLRERELMLEYQLKQQQAAANVNAGNATNLELPQ